jgi:hypothetical protein
MTELGGRRAPMRVRIEGSTLGESGASSVDFSLLATSIREDETALCLDCSVTFNIRNRTCPKCGGEQIWLTAKWRRQIQQPAAPAAFRVPPARPTLRLLRTA